MEHWREVSVWDTYNGDLVVKEWACGTDRYDEILDMYSNDPMYSISVDDEWWDDEDD